VTAPLASVGWNGTDGGHTRRLLRANVVGAACRWHVGTARATALALFNAFMSDPVANDVVPDLRDAVYTVGVAEGGEAAWLFIYNRYKTTKVQAEARRCLVIYCLGHTLFSSLFLIKCVRRSCPLLINSVHYHIHVSHGY
jgi:hypothetical protein